MGLLRNIWNQVTGNKTANTTTATITQQQQHTHTHVHIYNYLRSVCKRQHSEKWSKVHLHSNLFFLEKFEFWKLNDFISEASFTVCYTSRCFKFDEYSLYWSKSALKIILEKKMQNWQKKFNFYLERTVHCTASGILFMEFHWRN